ncbi:tripartite tricarboxylate transporter substrate binding protein [Ancylobacter sp. MQZ15Z-1]|uniref:Tripartite tricarboxylate transporter substrate binding protein n=1 Tax=Ancylobacter mangrovi TaxID=2972472 RepID=A0A9X2PLZ8_9HYPH|nr:tripartite tricarboxylate transporter substrate binding protein [Ancylobacter mangrovi]MCS0496288.1 tripartite tricarboxylate transporter substrate binding protein [Ancylobacter mangrovi]
MSPLRAARPFHPLLKPSALAFALGLACASATGAAMAQSAPTGPIEITTGTSPGGTPDVLMRRAAKILNEQKIITNPLVVQNRTGGSWMVAGNFVMGKKGDRNVVLCIAQPILTTPITQGLPTLYDKLTPIAMFIQGDLVLVVQPDSPVKNLKQLMELAAQRERSLKVAGAQAGSTDHMVAGLVEKAGKVKLNYIPFDGGGSAQAAFLGGNVDLMTLTPSEAMPLVTSGKARILAILSDERRPEPELKDVPTAKEQGYDIVWGQAWGLAGPPELDADTVKFWDDAIAKLVANPEWQASLKENFLRSKLIPAAEVKPYMQKLHEEHLALLRDLGLAKQPPVQ